MRRLPIRARLTLLHAAVVLASASVLLGVERPAHVVAVQRREVPVEHDDVVGMHARVEERLRPVERDVDRRALAAQAAGDRVGDARLVLGDQDPH